MYHGHPTVLLKVRANPEIPSIQRTPYHATPWSLQHLQRPPMVRVLLLLSYTLFYWLCGLQTLVLPFPGIAGIAC